MSNNFNHLDSTEPVGQNALEMGTEMGCYM